MRKIFIILLLAILLFSSLTACKNNKKTRYEAEFLTLFDTVTKIIAYSESKSKFTEFSQLIYDELKIYHELYDIYNDYNGINNIKTINDNAGIKPVKVDKKIIDLIRFAKDKYTLTDGRMNIAYGAVLSIWHNYREEGIDNPENAELPRMDMLKEAEKHTDINDVVINEADSTVYLSDPDMSLDVGAVGKGYAVEQVAQYLINKGYTTGLLSVGGNVRAIGYKTDNNLWNIGVQNPDTESEKTVLEIAYITDKSLVTSGDYERYYTVNGKRYHHIIDPQTLYPAEYMTAVTIICKDSGLADTLSTAVFNMPYEEGLKFINNLPDTEALWVLKNGEIKYSDNFMELLKK